ncbi:MAG TPA: hypothetical protein GX713_03270 [Mollicutes bacterium]|nr:hypothetical protein [Mollicutes bacterium]
MNKIFKAHINIREGSYNYPGYNEEKGVNHPVLFTGMTPIKWDGTLEINTTEDDPDWYDYNEKRWANAKSLDGSYWVWIPRYAYKIESCYHTSGEDCYNLTGKEAGDIDVKFLKGTTNLTEDNTTIESTGYEAHEKDTSMHHFLHPAFQVNGEELGFWVAKFEATAAEGVATITGECLQPDDSISKTIKIVPNVNSWRCISIYNAYLVSLDMSNHSGVYGWLESEVKSHLITNYEWGAVAYLSASLFGAYEEIWNNTYNQYMTGCSSTGVDGGPLSYCIPYNTLDGVKSSTTHNIYGVYDMSGGAWDIVMGNYNDLVGNSNFLKQKLIEDKYINKYFTENKQILNSFGMNYVDAVYGDAFFETSYNAARYNGSSYINNNYSSWNYDQSHIPHLNQPWFYRGNRWGGRRANGIFSYSNTSGTPFEGISFRPVLMPLKHASS